MGPLVAAVVLIGVSIWLAKKKTNKAPLPPGPPADPLIGHLRIIPQQKMQETFQKWANKYGDIVYLEVLGRKMMILSSPEIAQALLENRGANYSGRPKFTLYEVMGWVPVTTLLQPSDKRFLRHRKMFQQTFGPKECLTFDHDIADEAHLFIKNLTNAAPGTHRNVIQRYTVSIVMRTSYGHRIRSDDDEFMKIADGIGVAMHKSGPPGNTPIDIFPWLQHMPSWFPGTYYMSVAKAEYKNVRKLFDFPVEFVQNRMKTENYEDCFVSQKLQELDGNTDSEGLDDVKGASATVFSAGVDTSYATLVHFALAMILHPECQKRAHEEIISVLGPNALPDLSDRESLPYVEGIVQEVIRWNPVAALGVPHLAIEDDIYEGMFIPKGTLMIPNIRGMGRHEKTYSDPDKFDPTRFLPQPQGRGEPHFAFGFGFGRRACPGRHFASLMLWHAIACILATLELAPAKDEKGDPKVPSLEFTEGLVSEPLPFDFEVHPRSEAAQRLIAHIDA
ncbi:hypothetical protein V5O48_003874 [Marasmius crinis-equi]|uniref:Cytochrome P450 n=1 Tax=Marasmius crinis-equi TaxID=585013 RepID=A0ABR3FRP9_9AGAR